MNNRGTRERAIYSERKQQQQQQQQQQGSKHHLSRERDTGSGSGVYDHRSSGRSSHSARSITNATAAALPNMSSSAVVVGCSSSSSTPRDDPDGRGGGRDSSLSTHHHNGKHRGCSGGGGGGFSNHRPKSGSVGSNSSSRSALAGGRDRRKAESSCCSCSGSRSSSVRGSESSCKHHHHHHHHHHRCHHNHHQDNSYNNDGGVYVGEDTEKDRQRNECESGCCCRHCVAGNSTNDCGNGGGSRHHHHHNHQNNHQHHHQHGSSRHRRHSNNSESGVNGNCSKSTGATGSSYDGKSRRRSSGSGKNCPQQEEAEGQVKHRRDGGSIDGKRRHCEALKRSNGQEKNVSPRSGDCDELNKPLLSGGEPMTVHAESMSSLAVPVATSDQSSLTTASSGDIWQLRPSILSTKEISSTMLLLAGKPVSDVDRSSEFVVDNSTSSCASVSSLMCGASTTNCSNVDSSNLNCSSFGSSNTNCPSIGFNKLKCSSVCSSNPNCSNVSSKKPKCSNVCSSDPNCSVVGTGAMNRSSSSSSSSAAAVAADSSAGHSRSLTAGESCARGSEAFASGGLSSLQTLDPLKQENEASRLSCLVTDFSSREQSKVCCIGLTASASAVKSISQCSRLESENAASSNSQDRRGLACVCKEEPPGSGDNTCAGGEGQCYRDASGRLNCVQDTSPRLCPVGDSSTSNSGGDAGAVTNGCSGSSNSGSVTVTNGCSGSSNSGSGAVANGSSGSSNSGSVAVTNGCQGHSSLEGTDNNSVKEHHVNSFSRNNVGSASSSINDNNNIEKETVGGTSGLAVSSDLLDNRFCSSSPQLHSVRSTNTNSLVSGTNSFSSHLPTPLNSSSSTSNSMPSSHVVDDSSPSDVIFMASMCDCGGKPPPRTLSSNQTNPEIASTKEPPTTANSDQLLYSARDCVAKGITDRPSSCGSSSSCQGHQHLSHGVSGGHEPSRQECPCKGLKYLDLRPLSQCPSDCGAGASTGRGTGSNVPNSSSSLLPQHCHGKAGSCCSQQTSACGGGGGGGVATDVHRGCCTTEYPKQCCGGESVLPNTSTVQQRNSSRNAGNHSKPDHLNKVEEKTKGVDSHRVSLRGTTSSTASSSLRNTRNSSTMVLDYTHALLKDDVPRPRSSFKLDDYHCALLHSLTDDEYQEVFLKHMVLRAGNSAGGSETENASQILDSISQSRMLLQAEAAADEDQYAVRVGGEKLLKRNLNVPVAAAGTAHKPQETSLVQKNKPKKPGSNGQDKERRPLFKSKWWRNLKKKKKEPVTIATGTEDKRGMGPTLKSKPLRPGNVADEMLSGNRNQEGSAEPAGRFGEAEEEDETARMLRDDEMATAKATIIWQQHDRRTLTQPTDLKDNQLELSKQHKRGLGGIDKFLPKQLKNTGKQVSEGQVNGDQGLFLPGADAEYKIPPGAQFPQPEKASQSEVKDTDAIAAQDDSRVLTAGAKASQDDSRVLTAGAKASQDDSRVLPAGAKASQDDSRVLPADAKASQDDPRVLPAGAKASQDDSRVLPAGGTATHVDTNVIPADGKLIVADVQTPPQASLQNNCSDTLTSPEQDYEGQNTSQTRLRTEQGVREQCSQDSEGGSKVAEQ